jgi:hypothetical protein
MVYRGGCGSRLDDECASLSLTMIGIEVGGARTGARRDLFLYIEGFYNSRRLHSALGYVGLAQTERIAAYPSIFRGKITAWSHGT